MDFVIGGIPAGSPQPDVNGKATVNVTAWSAGTVKVDAVWVRYVGGVPVEKVLSALITVT